MYVFMYVCIHVCIHVCMYVWIHKHTQRRFRRLNLFWLRYIGGISVAVDAHHICAVFMTFHFVPTWHEVLLSGVEESFCHMFFNQVVTAYFMSTSVVNHLPVRCFLMGPNRWKTLGPRSSGPKFLKNFAVISQKSCWQSEVQRFTYLWTRLEASG